jgi:hypothetical protein
MRIPQLAHIPLVLLLLLFTLCFVITHWTARRR